MVLLDLLNGISPWWWVAFGVALGAAEMATMSFFLIWPAMAAVLLAILLWAIPGLSAQWQIVAFAVLSVVLLFAGRAWLNRYGDGGAAHETLNSRSNQMIGRHARVEEFIGPEGSVTIDGVRWHAVWPKGAVAKVGDSVQITGADGMKLHVKADD